ncbi:MAG: hypothetical protein IKN43_03180 [Selenomonadaceae bacterium]|nr:hypothetical protein [Selenomonadaceae bacterium]
MQVYAAPKIAENFSGIEEPIYPTNEGNCVEFFEELAAEVENKLDEADFLAKTDSKRMTHNEVFESLRRNINV